MSNGDPLGKRAIVSFLCVLAVSPLVPCNRDSVEVSIVISSVSGTRLRLTGLKASFIRKQ